MNKSISPTGRYIAICNKMTISDYSGHYCKQFQIPMTEEARKNENIFLGFENNSEHACWYFMNRLDPVSYVELVISFEDYQNLTIAQ